VFLVDKEPLGLRGEAYDTLVKLKEKGTTLILGLRDVMDDPVKLAEEWERKNAIPALEKLYDFIWVYGLPEICNPLAGLPISDGVIKKMQFTGYLRRASASSSINQYANESTDDDPYILVTTGGGGDGAQLIDWVLRAYEDDPHIPYPAKLVFGPFMSASQQTGFMDRVNSLEYVSAITFDADIEGLLENAVGVVSMGGYNTFCELLSFDNRGLVVPRTIPRMEQYIRASRAEQLGLIRMLMPGGDDDTKRMVDALHGLAKQAKPSEVHIPGLLGGLPVINMMMEEYLGYQMKQRAKLSVVGE
jgi:predicted glycosyltransferase